MSAASSVLVIPRAPERLALGIERFWDGTPCPHARLHGRVELAARGVGLELVASLPHQPKPRVPAAPLGDRVSNLWEYDVVECFLVGAGGRYLEIELGAGGHFLVLSFSGPRIRSDGHESFRPELDFTSDPHAWCSRLFLDWELVPPALERLNAFVSAGGAHLAYGALPGPAPDFHQPARFPRARLDSPPRVAEPGD
jgi:hypothetical protein